MSGARSTLITKDTSIDMTPVLINEGHSPDMQVSLADSLVYNFITTNSTDCVFYPQVVLFKEE